VSKCCEMFYLYTVVLVRKRKYWLARNLDNVSKCGEMFYLHTVVLVRKRKYWLARNQDNVSNCGEMFYLYTVVLVSKCGEMCTCTLLFSCLSVVKCLPVHCRFSEKEERLVG
jgi:hypothetical protein